MVYDDAGDGGLPINTSGIGSCVCLNCRGVLRGVNHELRSENVVLIERVLGSRLVWRVSFVYYTNLLDGEETLSARPSS